MKSDTFNEEQQMTKTLFSETAEVSLSACTYMCIFICMYTYNLIQYIYSKLPIRFWMGVYFVPFEMKKS